MRESYITRYWVLKRVRDAFPRVRVSHVTADGVWLTYFTLPEHTTTAIVCGSMGTAGFVVAKFPYDVDVESRKTFDSDGEEAGFNYIAEVLTDCAGTNQCHGCMKWCENCGDVAHVCDIRLRGEPCDQHPIPHARDILEARRRFWERELAEGKEKVKTATNALELLRDDEVARKHYDRQEHLEREAQEAEFYGVTRKLQTPEAQAAAHAALQKDLEDEAAHWGYRS